MESKASALGTVPKAKSLDSNLNYTLYLAQTIIYVKTQPFNFMPEFFMRL
jgi:hypothetical protein